MKNQNTILIAILSALACLAFLPETRAVEPAAPVPDPALAGGNTADGQNALLSLTTGTFNTAIGFDSLLSLTDTSFNTGVGAGTLLLNTGTENTATGAGALLSTTTGSANTAVGAFALFNNIGGGPTSGNNNTAVGDRTLLSNNTGNFNTAVGATALGSNTTGSVNVAIGHALSNNTSGTGNVAIGGNAGLNADTGDHNVYIGQGMVGVAGESDSCYIRSIFGQPVDIGTVVFMLVDANNKIGTVPTDANGNKVTVLGPLELQAALAQQQKQIEILTARLKEQAAQIQKVSAQIEMSKPAAKVVLNNP